MRRTLIGIALFVVAFAAYVGNGETISSFDSAPTTLFAFNLFEHRTPDYDAFRGSYLDRIGGGYAFVEAPNGHRTSLFPIGTSLLTLPVYAVLYAVRVIERGPPPILSPTFEDERRYDEKIVAALIAAAAVVLCFLTLRRMATPFQAGIATFVFGFAGEMWTIGAQGLWQHGAVNLVALAAIYATLRAIKAERARLWMLAAGLCAGMLVTIRPTAALFGIAIALFIAAQPNLRRTWAAFAGGAAIGIAPAIGWNLWYFHSVAGGYAANLGAYDFAPAHVAVAVAGLLISPSRGWLCYSPIVAFAMIGVVRASRIERPAARLVTFLGGSAVALFVNYALFGGWIGGACYGPRFLTDLSAVMALGLVYVIPPSLSAVRAAGRGVDVASAVFCVALLASTLVQIVGSYSGAAGPLWNAIPIDIGAAPERVWAIRDGQIERNARAMFFRYAPVFPTGGSAYAAGFAGRVTAVRALPAEAGARPLVSVHVQNDGRSIWYGYDTAVYNGEARVRATFADRSGATTQQELYIRGTILPGGEAVAFGLLDLPRVPGPYDVTFDTFSLGRSDVSAANLRGLRMRLFIH